MNEIKEHLEEAFEKGRSYDYRPTWYMCFNRWYNEKFVNSEKCNTCKYSNPISKTNHNYCKKCIDCSLYKEQSR